MANIHEKIANQRADFLHNQSFGIINENQVIVLEDLKVKHMVKNHHLAKAISEASWSEFREMIEYKAQWYGRKVIIASQNYAAVRFAQYAGIKTPK